MTTQLQKPCAIEVDRLSHFDLLKELDLLTLKSSCCDICECDCYSTHRIENSKEEGIENYKPEQFLRNDKRKIKKRTEILTQSLERRPLNSKHLSNLNCSFLQTKALKRSKSSGNLQINTPFIKKDKVHYIRDCEFLQNMIGALKTPRAELIGIEQDTVGTESYKNRMSVSNTEFPSSWKSLENGQQAKTCQSLANLCLTPSVRKSFEKIPMHDQKIINRMASKRNEKIMAKENAWLARKFWENERYERELLKCEQMEEYKRAVRDKQYRDFILTKERLNHLAQRDFQELQRLRSNLAQKDVQSKRRLDAIRVERNIMLCQRRCEELKKSEAVNSHQEEQRIDYMARKHGICNRLTHRLRRANEIRNEQLESYLKRLKYDNLVQHLTHQDNWHEIKEQEKRKQFHLMEEIKAKSKGAQRFIEQRRQQMENLSKTAKISASLRELIRSSVTPEDTIAFCQVAAPSKFGNLQANSYFQYRS